jgi:hypothetical protein
MTSAHLKSSRQRERRGIAIAECGIAIYRT